MNILKSLQNQGIHITKSQLAKDLGVSEKTLNNWYSNPDKQILCQSIIQGYASAKQIERDKSKNKV